jgi:hypothetical protein
LFPSIFPWYPIWEPTITDVWHHSSLFNKNNAGYANSQKFTLNLLQELSTHMQSNGKLRYTQRSIHTSEQLLIKNVNRVNALMEGSETQRGRCHVFDKRTKWGRIKEE